MLVETQKPELRSPENLISLSLLRKRIPPEFQNWFCEDAKLCLDCGGNIVEKDEELCCSKCGRVWSEQVKVEIEGIPFETDAVESGHAESHWQPGCQLAFGKGLGSYMALRSFYRVLASAPSGKENLGLRVQHTKIMVNRFDHPFVTTMLSYGSALAKDFNLHDGTEFGIKFADFFGHAIRKVSAYYIIRNESQAELHAVVKGIFAELYLACFPDKTEEVLMRLQLTQEDVNFAGFLLGNLTKPKRKAPRKSKQKEA